MNVSISLLSNIMPIVSADFNIVFNLTLSIEFPLSDTAVNELEYATLEFSAQLYTVLHIGKSISVSNPITVSASSTITATLLPSSTKRLA